MMRGIRLVGAGETVVHVAHLTGYLRAIRRPGGPLLRRQRGWRGGDGQHPLRRQMAPSTASPGSSKSKTNCWVFSVAL